MKSNRFFAALTMASAVLVSCTKIEHEDFTPYPSKIVKTDASGGNIEKKEYTYSTSGETLTQKNYTWSGSEWTLKNDYAFTYEYNQSNLVKNYTAADNGSPAYRYDFEYNSYKLVALQTLTKYQGDVTEITMNKYDYEISNNAVKVKYTYQPDETGSGWKDYIKEDYQRYDDGSVSSILQSVFVDGEYEEDIKILYGYINGYISSMDVFKMKDGQWQNLQSNEYAYDRHGRTVSNTVTAYNIDVKPATTVVTTETFYYPD